MKKTIYCALPALLLFAASCTSPKPPGDKDTLTDAGVHNQIPANCFCADTTTTDSLCREIPHEVAFTPQQGYHSVLSPQFQGFFDEFSWQSFVAFNWPSTRTGTPVGSFFSGGDSMRVWETYQDPGEVFYTYTGKLGLAAATAKKKGRKFFYMTSKISPDQLNGSAVTMFDGYALIDRNLNFSLYEEKINPDEVNYINTNNLHTLSNIIAYGNQHNKQLTLPAGFYTDPVHASGGQVGAAEIKAVWRILDPSKGDDPSRFYTQQADIYVPAGNSATGAAFTITDVTVGLVAMHIIHNTQKFSSEIWSTFVHDDNNPDSAQYANKNFGSTVYSYFDPAAQAIPVNKPIKAANNTYKWAPQAPYAAAYFDTIPGTPGGPHYGNQVYEVKAPYITTVAANTKWKAKLAAGNSVWSHYRLLGTQWFIGNSDTPGGSSDPAPPVLGNPTLETFIQSKSNCIGCHQGASVNIGTDTVTTDFSFLFGHAK
jgi:hypothetical protein